MPITRTSLKHPTIKTKLHAAMREASRRSRVATGNLGTVVAGSIQVTHTRHRPSLPVARTGFHFFDITTGREISRLVRAALREE